MPHIRQCQNHTTCKGVALEGDHLCRYCRDVADEAQRDARIERTHNQLTKKPHNWRDAQDTGWRRR